jgi:cystathionine beta-synthase
VFNDEWLARYGFLQTEGTMVAEVLAARDPGDIPPLVYVFPDTSVREAMLTMRKHGLSQLPVAKGEMPLAAAEVMGSVDELRLMNRVFADPSAFGRPVEDVMSPPLPTIGSGQPVELAVELLETAPALLVLDGGRPRAVLARTDVLTFLSGESSDEGRAQP